MSLAWAPSTDSPALALEVQAPRLADAPQDVRRALADLSRLLLAEPAYRVEPVLVAGEPVAALTIEHLAANPVVVTVSWP